MTKLPVRIHAGNNGVYDAVYRPINAVWRIRFIPWQTKLVQMALTGLVDSMEWSSTSYESAHEAMLAFERGPISYRSNEVVT